MTRPAAHRAIASLLIVSQLIVATGCTSWKTQSGNAQAVLAAQPDLAQADTTVVIGVNGTREEAVRAGSIRIATRSNPKMTEVTTPRVAGDSLYGVMPGSKDVTGVALASVTKVQVRKGSAGKTAALVVGVLAVGVLAGGMVAMSQDCWIGPC